VKALQWIFRILLAVVGGLSIYIAVQYWLQPLGMAGRFGLFADSNLGLATLRADMGAFFGAAGLFALLGALFNQGRFVTVPLVLLGLAFAGRVFSLATEGAGPGIYEPMTVEAVLIVIFGLGRLTPKD